MDGTDLDYSTDLFLLLRVHRVLITIAFDKQKHRKKALLYILKMARR